MASCGSSPCNVERETVQVGVRDNHVVTIQRQSTPFPRGSCGEWNGYTYRITGAGKTLYESKPVPAEVKKQLGAGSCGFEDKFATIEFCRPGGNILQYFEEC